VAGDHAALIDQRGIGSAQDAEDFKQRLSWKGTHNFYERFHDFVTMRDLVGVEFDRFDFGAWRNHWETQPDDYDDRPSQDAVVWERLADVQGPLHGRSVADYALRGSAADNPARGGASDLTDAGLRAEDLPTPAVTVEAPST